MITQKRLERLFARFGRSKVLVAGDFFLDKYLFIDPALAETSLETGLGAHQVTGVRCSPGAAGTVTNNLRAMGAGVLALGVVGEDGEGHDLKRMLRLSGVDTENVIEAAELRTPTYCKPMVLEANGTQRELNRLDTKNRVPLPARVEDELIKRLRLLVPEVNGVILADQVQERNCGVLSDRLRAEAARLARMNPGVFMAADSREHIALFENVIVKPNAREAGRILDPNRTRELEDWPQLVSCARAVAKRNGKPALVTMGANGVLVAGEHGLMHVPACRVTGPIDICGAGDSTLAGIMAALCAGAELWEAAVVGSLAAAVTIRQIGTTGTASCEQMLKAFADYPAGQIRSIEEN